MTLERFWNKSSAKMTSRRHTKTNKATAAAHEASENIEDHGDPHGEASNNMASISTASAGDASTVVSIAGLDPAIANAFDLMTANITKVIDSKLSPLVETIHKHTAELQAAGRRLDEAEAKILSVETETAPHEQRLAALEKQVTDLTESLDMAENYSRRLNLRVVNLEEDVELAGRDPVDFFESWLPRVLGMTTKDGRVKLERAHRTLAQKPVPTAAVPHPRPRAVLLRFHAFRDKQRAMEAARNASLDGGVKFNGSKLMFFNDFSATVMKRRKRYDDVKKKLREKKIPYAMLFPAILEVTQRNGSKERYKTPEEAQVYANSLT